MSALRTPLTLIALVCAMLTLSGCIICCDIDSCCRSESMRAVGIDFGIPDSIMAAATEAVPGFRPREVELEIEDDRTIYELEGTANGREYEIEIDSAGTVLEIEESLSMKDVPQAVLDGAKKAVPGFSCSEAEKVTAGTKITYELEGSANGKAFEIELTPSGDVLEVEQEDEQDDEE